MEMEAWESVNVYILIANRTSLLIRYCTGEAPMEYIPTVFDNNFGNVVFPGSTTLFSTWDTAGSVKYKYCTTYNAMQEKYDRLRPLSYPGTDVILMCFAIDNITSFNEVNMMWIDEVQRHAKGVPIILVGTKSDLRNDVARQKMYRIADLQYCLVC